MTGTTLWVEKGSDPMRATFVAVGLAHLVSTLVPQQDVHIRDVSTAFRLTTAATRREIEIAVQARGLPQLLPAIRKPLTKMEQVRRDQGVPIEQLEQRYIPIGFPHDQIVDYAETRERWRAACRRSPTPSEDRPQPDPRFTLWAHLCSHFGLGSSMLRTYPLLVHLWFAHKGEAAVALGRLIVDYFSDVGCDYSAAGPDIWLKQIRPQLHHPQLKQFNWTATASQVSALAIISPTSIKGSNTASARQQPHNKNLKIFWLEAYLAFAGFLTLALPYYWQPTRRSRKNVATYYPVPSDVLFSDLQAIMDRVRGNPELQSLYDSSPRLPRAYTDVWNTLLFNEALYGIRAQRNSHAGTRPGITGLAACYYKDISNHVPLEENHFADPARLAWNVGDSSSSLPAPCMSSVLIQALEAIRDAPDDFHRADNGTRDVVDRLRAYLLAPTARNWADFGLAYGQHGFHQFRSVWYLHTLVRDQWEQQLMTHTPSNYAEILRDPGFTAIAAAIHFATTGLLWRTQRPQNPQPSAFRIRYGLDRDLLEHARDPARFIGALSEFLRTYAWERERLRVNNIHNEHWPPEVTDEHFYRVVTLIDQHGSELVARLLVTSALLRPERA